MGPKISKHNVTKQPLKDDPSNLKTLKRCISLNDEKIDKFVLIWLDEKSNEDTLDSLRTKTLLRQINNDHCLFFHDANIFLHEIEKIRYENTKILVVTSGSLAKTVLPKTKDTIPTIIIFCENYNKYTELANIYLNVIDVCTEHETLKNCIQREISSLKFNLFINQTFKSIRILSSSQDTTDNSGAYFSYILFIEVLKQMPQTKQSKEIMLNKCIDYYRRNKAELDKIEKFRSTYTAEKAVDWYSQDSFVYRLVNQAFRTEDITLWYLFRFFIIDLCTQLEKIHKEQDIQDCFTVYRGQAHMPTKELENLRSNIDGLISTNGFLSTSKQIEIAQIFIADAKHSDDFKVVLFEITVDASRLQNIIFVDVGKYTRGNGENEVLFSIGSVFKIQSVEYNSDLNTWKIKMKATDEGTDDVKHRIETIRKKYQNKNINLLFGRLLLDMSQYAKAESYFQMMLYVLPKHHQDFASVYDHIGDLNMCTTNWNEAYKNFTFAYEIKTTKLHSNHPSFAVTLNGIGNYYKAIGDMPQAYNYYSRALHCSNTPYNIAIAKLNVGTIYTINGEFENALGMCIESRDILQSIEPCPQPEIISCLGMIGDIYLAQKNYSVAKDFYSVAFELSKRYLYTSNHGRTRCVKALVDLYQHQGDHTQAITFCLEQLSFYHEHLGEDDISVGYLLMKLGECYENDDQQKLPTLNRALQILVKNVHFEYATTSVCLMMVANCYVHQNEHEKASRYYLRALEIQNKIYPAKHSMIIETQKLLDSNQNNSN